MTGVPANDRGEHLDREGFVDRAVIPDGEGGWRVVSLGEPFKRIVMLDSEGAVPTGVLMRLVKEAGIDFAPGDAGIPAGPGGARVLLVNIECPNHYGVRLLVQQLRDSRIDACAVYLPSRDYIRGFGAAVRTSSIPGPNIIGIAVDSWRVEDVIVLISLIRRQFPEAFVLIGGPETQHSEQLAVLLDDFDVLIKGQAVGVVADVARVIGDSRRGSGLSRGQLDQLASLRGGILARNTSALLYNNLALTNMPEDFHILRPEGAKQVHYWHSSVGCPRSCGFCYHWTGRRYHMAVPYHEEPEEKSLPRHERSARAMKEWLVCRLAIGMPGNERIRVFITDDDFLVSRERVEALHRHVTGLGLQNHFEFACICSVASFVKGGRVDRQLIGWLMEAGFGDILLGTDGLCDGVLDANRKGYSLEQTILVNRALLQAGLRPQHNIIWSTPFTTEEEITESLLLFHLLPFCFNPVQNIAIGGTMGSTCTNGYVSAHSRQYVWPDASAAVGSSHCLSHGWRVPSGFPEYAAVSIGHCYFETEDRRAQEIVEAIEQQGEVSLGGLIRDGKVLPETMEAVVSRWRNSPGRELRSLAQVLDVYRNRIEDRGLWRAIEAVKHDMMTRGVYSFEEYLDRLREHGPERDNVAARAIWPREPQFHFSLMDALAREGRLKEAVVAWSNAKGSVGLARRHVEFLRTLLGRYGMTRAIQRTRLAFLDVRDGYHEWPLALYLMYSLIGAVESVAAIDEITFRLADLHAASRWCDLLDTLTFAGIDRALESQGGRVASEVIASGASSFLGVPFRVDREAGRSRLTLDLEGLDAGVCA
jgi:hypothetical protein